MPHKNQHSTKEGFVDRMVFRNAYTFLGTCMLVLVGITSGSAFSIDKLVQWDDKSTDAQLVPILKQDIDLYKGYVTTDKKIVPGDLQAIASCKKEITWTYHVAIPGHTDESLDTQDETQARISAGSYPIYKVYTNCDTQEQQLDDDQSAIQDDQSWLADSKSLLLQASEGERVNKDWMPDPNNPYCDFPSAIFGVQGSPECNSN